MTRTRTIRKALTLLAVFGAALAFALAARGTAGASTVPQAHTATCKAFTRWWDATEGGYRYEGYQPLVARIVRRARTADDQLRADVLVLAWVAPLADVPGSPAQEQADMAAIDQAAGWVALDCSVRI